MARALGRRHHLRVSAIPRRPKAVAARDGGCRAPARFLPPGKGFLRGRIRACAPSGLAARPTFRHRANPVEIVNPDGGLCVSSSLSPEAFAVIEGRHSDPFRYLGLHTEGGNPVVRVFLPDAPEVAVIDERGRASVLGRVHEAGLFAGPLSEPAQRYRLRVHFDGNVVELEDPYRFPPILSDLDLYLLGQGSHILYDKVGAHPWAFDGVAGVAFVVFAPNARRVSVVGDFNFWDGRRHAMRGRGNGFWEIFVPATPG